MALLPTQPDPDVGSATGFATNLLNNLAQLRLNDQTLSDRFEETVTAIFGRGIVTGSYTGDLVAVGTGLTVNVAACEALIGFAFSSAAAVVPVAAASTLHLYLFQDGTFDSNTTGTYPGTTTNPAIEIATVVTGSSTVTSVTVTADLITLDPYAGSGTAFTGTEVRERITTKTGGAAFDAAADRTGAACTVTVAFTPAVDTQVDVMIGRMPLAPGDDWTIAGAVITLLDGAKPELGDPVYVTYWTTAP